MDHPTQQRGEQTDPLTTAAPTNRRSRHIRGALAATTSVGLLFGAGTAVAGASTATVSGTHRAPQTRAAFRRDDARNAGTVASVDGTSSAGACGTTGGSGALVVHTFKGATRTYDVDPSTTFDEPGVTSAGFNDVCVDGVVAVRPARRGAPDTTGATGNTADTGASGDYGGTGNTVTPSTTGVTAAKVFIAPASPTPTSAPTTSTTSAPASASNGFAPSQATHPQPQPNGARGAQPGPTAGSVEWLGIVTTKDPSSFDVASNGHTQVVDVTDTTTYVGAGGPTTYGSVAVGDGVRVSGTEVNGVLNATTVNVFPAPTSSIPGPQPGASPSPVPTATGFPAPPTPAPVTPSFSSPDGRSGPVQGESPQGQGFGGGSASAGGRGGSGR